MRGEARPGIYESPAPLLSQFAGQGTSSRDKAVELSSRKMYSVLSE